MATKTTNKGKATIHTPVPLEAQTRLMQIMNNTPAIKSFAGTEWEITALKPAVKNMIAEEAVKIQVKENAAMGDVLKAYASNYPTVCRVITLALLNDKAKIDKDYDAVYDTIYWESDDKQWATLLSEILQMLDVSFFFLTTNVLAMFQQMTTERKMTKKEAESLLRGQSSGK